MAKRKWKGAREGPVVGFPFGQEEIFFLSNRAVGKSQPPCGPIQDIRAKFWLE